MGKITKQELNPSLAKEIEDKADSTNVESEIQKVNSAIGQRVSKSGDEMTGHLTMPSFGTSKFKIKSFFLNMSAPLGNNEVEIDLGIVNFGGTLKVLVSSTWNTNNASGSVEKSIDFSGSGSIVWQRSKYTYISDVMNSCFMISDIYIKNGRKTIKIVRNASNTGGDVSILLEGFGFFPDLENASIGTPVVSTETFVTPSTSPKETIITSGFAAGWSGELVFSKTQEDIYILSALISSTSDIPSTQTIIYTTTLKPVRLMNAYGVGTNASGINPGSLIEVMWFTDGKVAIRSVGSVTTNVRGVRATLAGR